MTDQSFPSAKSQPQAPELLDGIDFETLLDGLTKAVETCRGADPRQVADTPSYRLYHRALSLKNAVLDRQRILQQRLKR